MFKNVGICINIFYSFILIEKNKFVSDLHTFIGQNIYECYFFLFLVIFLLARRKNRIRLKKFSHQRPLCVRSAKLPFRERCSSLPRFSAATLARLKRAVGTGSRPIQQLSSAPSITMPLNYKIQTLFQYI